jgi:hypothetical protein
VLYRSLFAACAAILLLGTIGQLPAAELHVGFAERDITPEVGADKPPVWMAGYGSGRKAKGVHDPLMARAMVLKHGDEKIAFASVDLIGLQYEAVLKIRERLPGYKHVTVGSTHNHEGPDVIGIWGPSPLQRGVNDDYVRRVIEQTAAAILAAEKAAVAATAKYGIAKDESLMDDNRLPVVKDGVLRTIEFTSTRDGKPAGLLVQWNCHPEALGPKNKLLTADFPAATVAWLQQKYHCPVLYMSGAVGGLMSPPDNRIRNDAGEVLNEGDFEYARRLGEETAKLATRAIESAEPVQLTPFAVAEKQIALPVENRLYRLARQLKVLKREGRFWTGDPENFGEVVTEQRPGEPIAIITEVSCLRLGQLAIANLPCELYPELVYGQFQEPVDPAADYPEASLEPTVASLMPSDKWLFFGLANDEVGYVIPKRQWDEAKPFCYGRVKTQYGEINSCGPESAPVLMKALADCARRLVE